MNQQLTTNAASSPPPKSTVNAALLTTPDNNQSSSINIDGGDDSTSISNILLNGGNTDVGGNDGDAAMDGGGTNNNSLLVPKSGSDSTEKDSATAGGDLTSKIPLESAGELVTSPNLVAQSTDDSTGDEVMPGDNTEGGVVNKDGSVQVLKAVSDSKSTNDEMARIQTEIADVQHLIKISTGDTLGIPIKDLLRGDALKITNADLLRLQHLLDKKKKMMTSDESPDGGLNDTQDDIYCNR